MQGGNIADSSITKPVKSALVIVIANLGISEILGYAVHQKQTEQESANEKWLGVRSVCVICVQSNPILLPKFQIPFRY